MKAVVLDVETTMRNTRLKRGADSVGDFSADPFFVDNRILCYAYGTTDGVENNTIFGYTIEEDHKFNRLLHELKDKDPHVLIVGHNVAFDIHYLIKHEHQFLEILADVMVWDTQTVEYLISGCRDSMISLEVLAQRYCAGTKMTTLYGEYGIRDTEDIPAGELLDYNVKDVEITRTIFKKQLEIVLNKGLMPVILARMRAYKAKIITEQCGLYINKVLAKEYAAEDRKILEEVKNQLSRLMFSRGIPVPNPSSVKQLATVLCGGTVKVSNTEPVVDEHGNPVVFKSGINKGKPRTKKVTSDRVIEPLLPTYLLEKVQAFRTPKGEQRIDDEVLSLICEEGIVTVAQMAARMFAAKILKARKYEKNLGTYLEAFPTLVHSDGLIHGNINTCVTATGRESSSGPNLQNVSNKGD